MPNLSALQIRKILIKMLLGLEPPARARNRKKLPKLIIN